MWNGPWGHMWWGWLFWLIVIGVIIWLIATLVARNSRQQSSSSQSQETALDILKKRYARGEISKQDFEEKKRDLES